MTFVHLRVHTEYSIRDGLCRLETPSRKGTLGAVPNEGLVSILKSRSAPAVAVTDWMNTFAQVKAQKALQDAGVKLVVGADVLVKSRSAAESNGALPSRVTLLVKDEEGHRNLSELLSDAHRLKQSQHGAVVELSQMLAKSGGLFALIGDDSEWGRLAHTSPNEMRSQILPFKEAFGDRLAIVVQRIGRAGEAVFNDKAIEVARHEQIPLVACNDVRFVNPDSHGAHEAKCCIVNSLVLHDSKRAAFATEAQYLRSEEEMVELFADLPDAIENTLAIAERCSFAAKLGDNHLPVYPTDGRSQVEVIRDLAYDGFRAKQARGLMTHAEESVYLQRLDYELGVIAKMGFDGYFLVVADFIAWAKNNDVPVGPGRGSGAGSLVAYSLGITNLDPLAYDLLFERFLNPERVSMPDFDVDFCTLGRGRVINYVSERYGAERVGQIATFGSMAARAVVRDVVRILGLPYGVGDRIAKAVPGAPSFRAEAQKAKMSELEYAYETLPDFKAIAHADEETRQVLELAVQLEGMPRSIGTHAGGVVIAPKPLSSYCPLYSEGNGGGHVTQLDMKDLELVGLIKFDFLGLRTLTVIDLALKSIAQRTGVTIDLDRIPQNDPKTFELFAVGATSAIFQMESPGMTKTSRALKPSSLEDIISLVALYRPGPMDLIPSYIDRKQGREAITYLHPDLEPILKTTYGVMVYQEQVMQIAQALAGYSLGEADLLRRAMGKKKPEEMAKQRTIFCDGAAKKGISGDVATAIFDMMEKFASYGFNKSHAAGYAVLAYQTAWLKANYPSDFMASELSTLVSDISSQAGQVLSSKQFGLTILPPNINHSGVFFEATDDETIRFSLSGIRGVGAGVAKAIVEERLANGPFEGLLDFLTRVARVSEAKGAVQALITAGAFDQFGHRASLLAEFEQMGGSLGKSRAAIESGQSDMFGFTEAAPKPPVVTPEWPILERLQKEHEVLGLFLSGHPIDVHAPTLLKVTKQTIQQAIDGCEDLPYDRSQRAASVLVGGWIQSVQNFGSLTVATLVDQTGSIKVKVGDRAPQSIRPILREGTIAVFKGSRITMDERDGTAQMFVDEAKTLESIVQRYESSRQSNKAVERADSCHQPVL